MKAMGIAIMVFAAAAVAVAGECVPLWPEGKMPNAQPQQNAAMLDEQQSPGFNPDEHRFPYIKWMPPPAGISRVKTPKGGYLVMKRK